MNINMFVSTTYNRLLADVRDKIGVSLDAPDCVSYEWAYVDGPKLDKQVLDYLEGRRLTVDLPEWLIPLWCEFVRKDDPVLLRYLRQLLVFCYKTEQQPTDEQLRNAQEGFEETEAGITVWDSCFSSNSHGVTLASARRIVGSIIYRINWSKITPSHGPGSVFPNRAPCEKSNFRTLYDSIVAKYPYDQYFCGLPNYWVDCMVHEKYGSLSSSVDIVSKLVAVPKDSRGPRLICVHPAEAIWIQQGQRRLLEARITSHPFTRGRINFTDQTVNGKLALSSSLSREYLTLDLKEASDRVSSLLVRSLFGDYAYDWISCSRANKVKLLDGRVIELKKWAPMGNALCFPIESLVFFSLVVAGIETHYGHKDCNDVYVFGDDIIFPQEYKEGVITTLVRFGLIPNISKTFSAGFFRESCGVEAYKGVDVTPIRLRKDNVDSLSSIVSICDLALRARLQGYDRCAAFLYSEIRSRLWQRGINLPISNQVHNGGFFEYQNIPFTEVILREPSLRYLKKWQRWTSQNWLVTGKQIAIRTGGWYHLQDSLIRIGYSYASQAIGSDTPSDRGTEYAVPRRTQLTRGWLNYSLE